MTTRITKIAKKATLRQFVNNLEQDLTDEGRLFKVVADFFTDFKYHLHVISSIRLHEKMLRKLVESGKTDRTSNTLARLTEDLVNTTGKLAAAQSFCEAHHVSEEKQQLFNIVLSEVGLEQIQAAFNNNIFFTRGEINIELKKMKVTPGLNEASSMDDTLNQIVLVQKELTAHVCDLYIMYRNNLNVFALAMETMFNFCSRSSPSSNRLITPIILEVWPVIRSKFFELATLDYGWYIDNDIVGYEVHFAKVEKLFVESLLEAANKLLTSSQESILNHNDLPPDQKKLFSKAIIIETISDDAPFELHYDRKRSKMRKTNTCRQPHCLWSWPFGTRRLSSRSSS